MTRILSLALLFAVPALAGGKEVVVSTGTDAPAARPRFSALGGKTLGAGADMLEAALGFPGLHVGYMHGLRNNLDLGGRISLNGAYEGMAPLFITGAKAQGVVKFNLLEKDKLSLALEAAPGIFAYSGWYQTAPGFTLPIAAKLGLTVTDLVGLAFVAESPLYFTFAPMRAPMARGPDIVYPAGLYLPLLAGAGVEIAALKNLLVTFDTRFGATYIAGNNTGAFTLAAKAGVAWRL